MDDAFRYTYDQLSRVTSLQRPNGVTTTNAFDQLSRLIRAAMTPSQVTISGKNITVGNQQIEVDFPVLDAFQIEDKIIVLYDPDAYTEQTGQFRNLVAWTLVGTKLWTAELPTTDSGDRYYRIASKDPLLCIPSIPMTVRSILQMAKSKQRFLLSK